jgi:serralysin
MPAIVGTQESNTIDDSWPERVDRNDREVINGLSGNDFLFGYGGDDFLYGGTGDDQMHGGGGVDTVSYAFAAGGVNASLLTDSATGEGRDTFSGVENLTGSEFDDQLTGDRNDNVLIALGGDDIVSGLDGDDLLSGGDGADALNGGAGIDTASYSDSAEGVEVNLATGLGFFGSAEGDTLTGIENLDGSDFDDTLTGNALANRLIGGLGDDTLNGGGGNDLLIGGLGDDTLNGGGGLDTAVFTGPASHYDISVNADVITVVGPDGTDTLTDIQRLSFNDALKIDCFGATHLDQVGNQFFLRDGDDAGSSLKFGGTAFTEGRFGAWTAIGAEQTAVGYHVAIQYGTADGYQVWNCDRDGNFVGVATAVATLPGSDMALQFLENDFHQDLNGNGEVGPVTTTIESFGATHLDQVGSWFFLRDAGGAGPSLKFAGTPFAEGRFGAWTAIAAEQTAGGYQVAIQFGTADQYQVWNTDAAGNFVGVATAVPTLSDSNMELQVLENAFHQDLNGNGQIGPVTTTIESFGATHLDLVGDQFFFRDAGGAGPSLKFAGTPFTEGRFGAWTAIGAEQTADGYQVAIQFGTADQYQVWNTDAAGNFVGVATAVATVSGSDMVLQSLENSFHQDLNHDGLLFA